MDTTELINLIGQNVLIALAVVVVLAVLAFLITRWVIATALVYIAKRTETKMRRYRRQKPAAFPGGVGCTAPGYLFLFLSAVRITVVIIEKSMLFLILWILVMTLTALLNALNEIYESRPDFSGVSIQGYLDIAKILVYLIGIILSISLFTGKSPVVLLSGLGAITAILLLIFRDTILSLVASIQISAYDLIKQGDWIEVPSYGADGDVMDISLHTIKIQNFDKTITMIPTYKMVEVSYKNWRGMQESGGRRIKRSMNLDVASLRFCDLETLKRYRKVDLIDDFLGDKIEQIEAYHQEHSDQSIPRWMAPSSATRRYIAIISMRI